jgi:hypothetical protein
MDADKGARTMTIYGVSQSSGTERRLNLEQGGEGVVLTITDHTSNQEQRRILVQAHDLLAAIIDPPAGGVSVSGIEPPHGRPLSLELEVRRNEVLLRVHAAAGASTDVAIGLDDFQDGLERVIKRA